MQATNRTFICSVVFLDVVEYSKKPVSDQIRFKERLNALLTDALANVAVNDRIILDTGDGAALSFLGDPEDALFVSLSLRDALLAPQPPGPELKLRIGINLGPVKVVKDINGQPNIIGDGINVAQRVMSFSDPGQVLVSRSYYEVVSCLSDDYGKLFHYEGARTDKHVREHEVYAVQATGEILNRVAAATPRKKELSRSGQVVLDGLSHSASFVVDTLRRKPKLGTALAVIAILAVATGLRLTRKPPEVPVAAPLPPAKVAITPLPAPVRDASRSAPIEKPVSRPLKDGTAAPAERKPQSAATPPAKAASTARSETRPPVAGGTGLLQFTIRPWGAVYVDGVHRGDVPPLYELRLSPGRHQLEIRHPEFSTYVQTVDVRPGARIQIKHWFLPNKHPLPSFSRP